MHSAYEQFTMLVEGKYKFQPATPLTGETTSQYNRSLDHVSHASPAVFTICTLSATGELAAIELNLK